MRFGSRRSCFEQVAISCKLIVVITEQEAEATLEFIASHGQSFGDGLDSRPEDDEPLSAEEWAALAASEADIAAGRTVSYAEVKQGLGAG